jgi:hypothetical protein
MVLKILLFIMKKSSTLSFLDVLSSNLNCCLLSKITISKLNFLRFDLRMMVPFIFMAMMFMFNTVTGQVSNKPGIAPVLIPTNGFAIDGDAQANHSPVGTTVYNNIGDWFENPGLGGWLINENSTFTVPQGDGTYFKIYEDPFKVTDPTAFPSSNKINDNPNTYIVGSANVPKKDDMQRAAAFFSYADENLPGGKEGDLWCIFAADRWEVTGSSYIDFEFNKAKLTLNADGTMTSEADTTDGEGVPTGGRTPGDILVTIEFVVGGKSTVIYVDKWDKLLGGNVYDWRPIDISNSKSVYISENTITDDAPWLVYDQGNMIYSKNQFAEGAINLTELMGVGKDLCGHLATVWCRTKVSHSTSAELADLAGPPFQIAAIVPELIATCKAPVDLPTCTLPADIITAYDNWKKVSFTGGVGTITPTLVVDPLPEDVACVGANLNLTYKVTDECNQVSICTSTFTITAPTKVVVNKPTDVTDSGCKYADQAAVNAAFTEWLKGFSVTNGCKPIGDYGNPKAPDLCGGFTEVIYTVNDLCEKVLTSTAKFSITAPTKVVVNKPTDVTDSGCKYSDQAAVDLAFTEWLKGFSVTNGCNPVGDYGSPKAPDLCGGFTEVTYTVNDLCEKGLTATAKFSITAPDPIVISDVKNVLIPSCTYGTQDDLDKAFALWLEGFKVVSGGCNPQGVFEGAYIAPNRVTGGFVDIVYNVTDMCGNGSSSARYTVDPCILNSAHCTYTQGYYGNLGGMSCADGTEYTTTALITKALEYYKGTMVVGYGLNTVSISTPSCIITVLPGGGGSYKLSGAKDICNLPSGYLTKKGTLNNTLLAQTITLGLNLGIDPSLGGFVLQAGELATAAPQGGCGTTIPILESCSIGEGYGVLVNEYRRYAFPGFVDGMTVKGLFDAANNALGGGTLPQDATMSTLANAVDMVNNAFDGCRIAMGYGVPKPDCTIATSPQEFVAFQVPIVNNQLTIKYKFSYVSDVIIDVFDAVTGAKVFSKLDTNSYLDKEVKLDYNFNTGTEKVYIVRLTTRLGHDEQKVMSNPY